MSKRFEVSFLDPMSEVSEVFSEWGRKGLELRTIAGDGGGIRTTHSAG